MKTLNRGSVGITLKQTPTCFVEDNRSSQQGFGAPEPALFFAPRGLFAGSANMVSLPTVIRVLSNHMVLLFEMFAILSETVVESFNLVNTK